MSLYCMDIWAFYSPVRKNRRLRFVGAVLFTLSIAACSGRGNVDLSKATPLTAEPVETPPGVTGGSDNTQLSSLFSAAPGQWIRANVTGGLVDPTGTTLLDDFDGDGLPNANEVAAGSNLWSADYPEIETQIAPPVTMKVEIMRTVTNDSKTVSSDITSDEMESKKNEGSEKFHQNELSERTVQYEREVSSSSSSSNSSSASNSSTSTSASASASGFMATANSDLT